MTSAPSVPKLAPSTLRIVAGVTIASAILRTWHVGESLWLDELHTSWCVHGDWSDVSRRALIGNQSPLYFYVVKLVVSVLGESEIALRLVSLLSGIALVPLTSLLAARLFSRSTSAAPTAAIIAAMMVGVSHLPIFYASEARPYALLQLVMVVHLLIAMAMIEQPTLRIQCLWAASAALVIHLHPTGLLPIGAELFTLAILVQFCPPNQRFGYRQLGLCTLLLPLLIFPQLELIRLATARRANWSLSFEQVAWHDLPQLFTVVPGTVLALAGLALVVAIALRPRASKLEDLQFSRIALVAATALLPLVLAYIASAAGFAPLLTARYLVCSIAPLIVLASLLVIVCEKSPLRAIAVGSLLVGFTLYQSGLTQNVMTRGVLIADRREDWRGLVEHLSALTETERPATIHLRSGLIEAPELLKHRTSEGDAFLVFPLTAIYQISGDPAPRIVPLDIRSLAREPRSLGASEALVLRGSERSFVELQQHPTYAPVIARFDQATWFGNLVLLRRTIK